MKTSMLIMAAIQQVSMAQLFISTKRVNVL